MAYAALGGRPVKMVGPSPKTAPSQAQSLSCSLNFLGFNQLSHFLGPANGLAAVGVRPISAVRPPLQRGT